MILKRSKNRKYDELRNIELIPNYSKFADGSCFMKIGNTHVLCTASIESKVPQFIRGTGKGWVTAEYGMLPRSTQTRIQRESVRNKQSGRTQEIQRLIGRTLRLAVDLEALGERQIIIDCDVIQADGGTRTAAITCGYIALHQAAKQLLKAKAIRKNPLIRRIAAISCGIINDNIYLDLEFIEDSMAAVDANFIFDEHEKIVELQLTSEQSPLDTETLLKMLDISKKAVKILLDKQQEVLNTDG